MRNTEIKTIIENIINIKKSSNEYANQLLDLLISLLNDFDKKHDLKKPTIATLYHIDLIKDWRTEHIQGPVNIFNIYKKTDLMTNFINNVSSPLCALKVKILSEVLSKLE